MAMLENPDAPAIYRTSGDPPFPAPGDALPLEIDPRQVTLRDRITVATILAFKSPAQVPFRLLEYLADQFSREIEKGDTYPMMDPLPFEKFGQYWFGLFGAVMILGEITDMDHLHELERAEIDWDKACLGSFYIKPNYPGRSSHICNGGFLVTDGARNRGVGRLMGETYLEWAPKLGYTYSVFNLVYETNVASCRIWDALGFKRIGRVKGAGMLKSYPGELVDAIIYGRDLGEEDDLHSEERFDKIRFYLKNGKYPNGADRAEKSRLRSAATHYRIIPPDGDQPEKLMLKEKEVISDPQRQYEVARQIHLRAHGGINKTTAAIAESYHWVRIKETVSQVIRNCPECSELNKNFANNSRLSSVTRIPLPPSGQGQQARNANTSPTTPVSNPRKIARRTREESAGAQLQVEASQVQMPHRYGEVPQFKYQTSYMMPVDPALMDGESTELSAAMNPSMSLEDLPPSPFLAASRNLPGVANMTHPDLSTSELGPGTPSGHGEDSAMGGVDDQGPPQSAGGQRVRRVTRSAAGTGH